MTEPLKEPLSLLHNVTATATKAVLDSGLGQLAAAAGIMLYVVQPEPNGENRTVAVTFTNEEKRDGLGSDSPGPDVRPAAGGAGDGDDPKAN